MMWLVDLGKTIGSILESRWHEAVVPTAAVVQCSFGQVYVGITWDCYNGTYLKIYISS